MIYYLILFVITIYYLILLVITIYYLILLFITICYLILLFITIYYLILIYGKRASAGLRLPLHSHRVFLPCSACIGVGGWGRGQSNQRPHRFSEISKYFQIFPDVSKDFQRFNDFLRCSHIFKIFQIYSYSFSEFQHISKEKQICRICFHNF